MLQGLEKGKHGGGMESLPYFLSIAFPGSRIFAIDFAGLDGKHRWKMFPKEAAVVNLHP